MSDTTLGDVLRKLIEEAKTAEVPQRTWMTMSFSFKLDGDQAVIDELWMVQRETD